MAAILKGPKIGSPSDLYLMASTFDIEGGLMSKKTWSETCIGGVCTVTVLSHGLTQKMTKMHEKYV